MLGEVEASVRTISLSGPRPISIELPLSEISLLVADRISTARGTTMSTVKGTGS